MLNYISHEGVMSMVRNKGKMRHAHITGMPQNNVPTLGDSLRSTFYDAGSEAFIDMTSPTAGFIGGLLGLGAGAALQNGTPTTLAVAFASAVAAGLVPHALVATKAVVAHGIKALNRTFG
jgi:hypothetical protein